MDKRENAAQLSNKTERKEKDFVFEKVLFNNVFEKDIQRVYLYKKLERLAKAAHMIAPAFPHKSPIRSKIETTALSLISLSTEPPRESREDIARELMVLMSMLELAKTSGALSSMNADIIRKETEHVLSDIMRYEEPRLFMDEADTLPQLVQEYTQIEYKHDKKKEGVAQRTYKGHIKDKQPEQRTSSRREDILRIIKEKGTVYIKDVSLHFRDVSEKTIQRELQALSEEGVLQKEGQRRWTTYTLTHR